MTHKVILDRELFVSKLTKAIAFIPKKSIIPAWDNFLLSIQDGLMTIVASDAEMNIRMHCQVQSKTDFAICVPAKIFFATISGFKENEVTITVKSDRKIELKSGRSKYNISMDCKPEGYGQMRMGEVKHEITMNQIVLRNSIKATKSFVDEDAPQGEKFKMLNINEVNNRIVFTGLKNILVCRAAVRPISIHTWESISISINTAKKIISLLGDKGEVSIAHSGEHIKLFTSKDSPDHFEVISVVPTLKFPNSEKIIAQRPQESFVVDTLDLRDAVKRLSLYAPEGVDSNVKISNAENSQELRLVSINIDLGHDGEEIVPIINPLNLQINRIWHSKSVIQVLGEIDQAQSHVFMDPNDIKGNSFVIPKVSTEEENIYTFIISAQTE